MRQTDTEVVLVSLTGFLKKIIVGSCFQKCVTLLFTCYQQCILWMKQIKSLLLFALHLNESWVAGVKIKLYLHCKIETVVFMVKYWQLWLPEFNRNKYSTVSTRTLKRY